MESVCGLISFQYKAYQCAVKPMVHNIRPANGRCWRKADLRSNLHAAEGSTSQIGLLLNSDLANPAPDGICPTALMRGHDS